MISSLNSEELENLKQKALLRRLTREQKEKEIIDQKLEKRYKEALKAINEVLVNQRYHIELTNEHVFLAISQRALTSPPYLSLKKKLEMLEVKQPKGSDSEIEYYIRQMYRKAENFTDYEGFEVLGKLASKWEKNIFYTYGRCRYPEQDRSTLYWKHSVFHASGDLLRLEIGNNIDVTKLYFTLLPNAIEEIKKYIKNKKLDAIQDWLLMQCNGNFIKPENQFAELLQHLDDKSTNIRKVLRLAYSFKYST